MSSIDLTYKGLTGVYGTVTSFDDTTTIDDLITAIAADEGLDTNYYTISKIGDPTDTLSITYGDSTTSVADLGIVDGDVILCTTNQNGSREFRQKQKLDIAAAKRNESYDITQLPSRYSGNAIVDNANTGGLLEGRPWVNTLVTNNLVVNLDAGNANSYPGSGATWTNLVDDTDYTITDGAFNSADGGSIVFNGSSTFVPIGTPLSAGTNYTKEAWVYDDGPGQNSRNILSTEDDVLFISGGVLYGGVGGSFNVVDVGSSLGTGVWRHVCLTFNDTTNTMVLYINGGNVNSSSNNSVTQSYSGNTLRIGSHFFNGSPVSFWNGKIAEVRVYNAALTEAQVIANYNATKVRYGV